MKPETKLLKKLTEKQKIFCREYVLDWNATRAYKIAYPKASHSTAKSEASKYLSKPNFKHVQDYIEHVKNNLEELTGITKAGLLNELKKIAYQNPMNVQLDWIKKKDYDKLTPEDKAAIRCVETEIRTVNGKQIPFIKIEFFDKQRAISELNKMLGYYMSEKIDIKVEDKRKTIADLFPPEL